MMRSIRTYVLEQGFDIKLCFLYVVVSLLGKPYVKGTYTQFIETANKQHLLNADQFYYMGKGKSLHSM